MKMLSKGVRPSRLALALAWALFLAGSLSPQWAIAQSAADPEPPKEPRISIGTGGTTGIYFAAGNAICRLLHRHNLKLGKDAPGTRIGCAAPATPGSLYNIAQLRERFFNFALVQSDWQYNAFKGTGRFEGQSFQAMRAVLTLHPEAFQIVAARGIGVAGFAGLKGKRIALGPKGSGTRGTLDVLLQAEGVDLSMFSRTEELSVPEQNKQFCDGNLDAVSFAIGIPSPAVAEAVERCGGVIVDLADSATKRLVAANPFYAFTAIPRSTYKGLEQDVSTFGVMATLVTRADTPNAVVYEVVRAVFEGLDELRAMHPAFARLQPAEMIESGRTAPLHPGAVLYYQKFGWVRPNGS